jgi:hypothetical protein
MVLFEKRAYRTSRHPRTLFNRIGTNEQEGRITQHEHIFGIVDARIVG